MTPRKIRAGRDVTLVLRGSGFRRGDRVGYQGRDFSGRDVTAKTVSGTEIRWKPFTSDWSPGKVSIYVVRGGDVIASCVKCVTVVASGSGGSTPPGRTTPTGPSQTEPGYDRFKSPTGNIRCEYVDQKGIACMTLNNGLGVLLRSFDRAYYLNDPYAFRPAAGRTLGYGSTWAVSSFRCSSSENGMKCSSTLTGHGFFINRTSRSIF